MTTRSLRSAVVLVVGSIAVAACSFSPRLDPRLPDPAASSHILAADGTVLATLDRGIHRTPISLRAMGHVVPDAVVAVEDHRYFEHSGIDVRAIARALRDDLRAGRVVEGGSTITQQYVRNVLLSGERTAHRKLREAILAIEVERHYTKAQILERYLNAVYFGDGAYGVETAAERYFGTSAARLTLGQGALLAGLLQAPEHDNPRRFPAAALARRNVVLDAMVRYHRTTPTAAAAAAAEPLRLAPPADDHGHAAYFVDAVRTWFLAQPRFGATEADRAHALYQGGLHIATTLDPTAQRAAENAVAGILTDRHHDPAAALVSIEPTTGRVVAYVGGRGTDGPEPWAQFDLAGRARRPAGSTFKPFVLSAALERHIPLTRSYDAPAALTLHPPGAPAWVVHNHDGRSYGRLDLVEATVQSVNTVYAQLMLDVGPTYAVGVARRLGIVTPLAPIAGAVLGFDDVSPVDLAQAYATIAADGVLTPATFVTSVTAPDGTVLYRAEPQHHRVLDAGVARTVNHTLEAVVQRGTGVAARIGRPVAGKTGALLVRQGNLVRPNATVPLVQINQIHPILVRFAVPEKELQTVQQYSRSGGTLRATARPAQDGSPAVGALSFVDNGVDTTTGTVTLKARFPNDDNRLWPGQFMPVTLDVYVQTGAVLVPSVAVQTGQEGLFVWVLDDAGKAQLRPVKVARTVGDKSVIASGLSAGERVVVDGQSRLTVGATVDIKTPGGDGKGTGAAGAAGDRLPRGLNQILEELGLPFVAFNQGSISHLETAAGMFIKLDYLRILSVLKGIKSRKHAMEEYGAAYTAEGIITLAGSRLYTSMADTDDVIDDALVRFRRVLEKVDRTHLPAKGAA